MLVGANIKSFPTCNPQQNIKGIKIVLLCLSSLFWEKELANVFSTFKLQLNGFFFVI
jgi:hypothetical protein